MSHETTNTEAPNNEALKEQPLKVIAQQYAGRTVTLGKDDSYQATWTFNEVGIAVGVADANADPDAPLQPLGEADIAFAQAHPARFKVMQPRLAGKSVTLSPDQTDDIVLTAQPQPEAPAPPPPVSPTSQEPDNVPSPDVRPEDVHPAEDTTRPVY